MGRSFLVLGRAATWLGSGYKDWKEFLSGKVPPLADSDWRGVLLDFHVTSFTRHGNEFDVDNLACVFFQASYGARGSKGRTALRWWRATLGQYPYDSLLVTLSNDDASFELPGVKPLFDEEIARPFPVNSREADNGMVEFVRSKTDGREPRREDRFALRLIFGPDQLDITEVEKEPIKPIVDCLYPFFGGAPPRGEDWKLFTVHIERGDESLASKCRVTLWHLDHAANEAVERTEATTAAPVTREEPWRTAPAPVSPAPLASGRAASSNYERLDEAARDLGSPPRELSLDGILSKARELYPEMRSTPRDGAGATMDFQCINVRGRANKPGNFSRPDRWNKAPAFIKVRPGVYRRLSDEERQAFARLWAKGHPLLRRESFEPRDWDAAASTA